MIFSHAYYFKSDDLKTYNDDILEFLSNNLSKFCTYNTNVLYDTVNYKKDIKPIFKKCNLKKGEYLREKIKKYIEANYYYPNCINRIVSLMNNELKKRKENVVVINKYNSKRTGKYLKNYYKNESI